MLETFSTLLIYRVMLIRIPKRSTVLVSLSDSRARGELAAIDHCPCSHLQRQSLPLDVRG
jgi:hypothetical protein